VVWLSGLLCSAAHALDWLELLNPHIVLDPRELSRYQFMGRQWGGGPAWHAAMASQPVIPPET